MSRGLTCDDRHDSCHALMFGACADAQLLVWRLLGPRAAMPVLRCAAQRLGPELRADGDRLTL